MTLHKAHQCYDVEDKAEKPLTLRRIGAQLLRSEWGKRSDGTLLSGLVRLDLDMPPTTPLTPTRPKPTLGKHMEHSHEISQQNIGDETLDQQTGKLGGATRSRSS